MRSRQSEKSKRQAWLAAFADAVKALGGPSHSLDWDTATHLYFEGYSPADAARKAYGS